MRELIASWILCANGCVNEIIIKTVIFNKITNILFNIFVNWKHASKRMFYFWLNYISGRVATRSGYNLVNISESSLKLCYRYYTIRQQILHQVIFSILYLVWVIYDSYREGTFESVLNLTCVLTRVRLLLTFL